MTSIIRTNSVNPDFQSLNTLLNQELAVIDGDDHAFYSQYNHTDQINHIVLAYQNQKLAGCGGMKKFAKGVMEIKRMYTLPEFRGRGIASTILSEIERWASDENYSTCILETGKRQEDAVALYRKNAYREIPNYGPYVGVDNSICFEKNID